MVGFIIGVFDGIVDGVFDGIFDGFITGVFDGIFVFVGGINVAVLLGSMIGVGSGKGLKSQKVNINMNPAIRANIINAHRKRFKHEFPDILVNIILLII